ncbi:hypothetical protein K435DRAFT_792880 [Dendrothele bispora CBS 962.96]|uniref:Uncharacterized protein n=1 Tax=Dendrothele bispora (strain CBS 962.96) TaxID=1314807 RepID=A0A4S8MHC9_DENBC|nr:hypothetical protein K435DRAFT_792880 [Dendrothele bispora CBS 962.96]
MSFVLGLVLGAVLGFMLGLTQHDYSQVGYCPRFQPTIGDAVDEYGSGYVSVHEINRFYESRRSGWSVEVLIAYGSKPVVRLDEHRAKRMLRPNRKYFGSYFSIGCLPELWTIVNSLNTDTFRYRGTDMRMEYEALGEVRAGVMDATMKFFQDRLESVKYRITTAEEVNAIMGTTRVEVILRGGRSPDCNSAKGLAQVKKQNPNGRNRCHQPEPRASNENRQSGKNEEKTTATPVDLLVDERPEQPPRGKNEERLKMLRRNRTDMDMKSLTNTVKDYALNHIGA